MTRSPTTQDFWVNAPVFIPGWVVRELRSALSSSVRPKGPALRRLPVVVLLLLLPALVPTAAQAKKRHKKHAKVYNLKLGLQKGHTASALIGDDGGTLTTKGSDGTRFTLTVAPGSMRSPARISMTPLRRLAGLPHKGKLIDGVKLEPSGLRFTTPAILRIHRKHKPTIAQLRHWGAVQTEGNGKGARSAQILPDPTRAGDTFDSSDAARRDTVLPIVHFSTGSMTSRIDAIGGPGQSAQDRADKINAPGLKALAAAHANAVADPNARTPVTFSRRSPPRPRRSPPRSSNPPPAGSTTRATPKPGDVAELLRLSFGAERQYQLIGVPSQKAANAYAHAEAAARRAADKILKKLIGDCRDRGFPAGYIRPVLTLLRQSQLVGLEVDSDYQDLLKCLNQHWTVRVSGTAGVAAKSAGGSLQLSQGDNTGLSSSTLGVQSTIQADTLTADQFGYHGVGTIRPISTKVAPSPGDNECAASWLDFEPSSTVGVTVRPDLNDVAGAFRRVFVIAAWDDLSKIHFTSCPSPYGSSSHDGYVPGLVGAAAPHVFSVPIGGTGHASAAKPDDLAQFKQTVSSFKASAKKGG